MNNNTVYIEKNSNPITGIKNLLNKIPLPDLTNKKILIKPNLGRFAKNGTGIITSIEVLEGIFQFFTKLKYKNLFLGDSPILGLKVFDIYKHIGLDKIAKQYNVKLLDFDAEKPTVIPIKNGTVIKQLKVYNKINEFDFIISVPVMKTHMHTTVSLSLKNLKGLIWRHEKVKLHQLESCKLPDENIKPLDYAIGDMSRILKPHLALIDGYIGQEGLGPAAGNPIKTNLYIGSSNYLFADFVGAKLMGINPQKINHLNLAFKYASLNHKDIKVTPSNFLDFRIKYKKSPDKLSIKFPNINVKEYNSCSACLSTLLLFLKAYAGNIKFTSLKNNCIAIRIGRGKGESDKNDILVGNCTRKYKEDNSIFIKGCPPVSSDIFKALKKANIISGEFYQNN